MAISKTAKKIRPLPGYISRRFTAASGIAAGAAVYLTSGGKVAEACAESSKKAVAIGIAVANQDGDTSFTTSDRVDVVVFGPVAGYSSLDEQKAVYVEGSSAAGAGSLVQTAPVAADVTGSTAYQFRIGRAHATSIIFVNPENEYYSTTTS